MEKKENYLCYSVTRKNLMGVLKKAKRGQPTIITVYGKPIAEIVQYNDKKGK
jgi:prevent-host-death family protein